jgi:DNA-binding MarR family transcriptional regulator
MARGGEMRACSPTSATHRTRVTSVSNAGNYTDDDLVMSWGLVQTNVGRAQRRLLDKLEEYGIAGQFFTVLLLLLKADDHRLPMSRIARDLSMSGGGFTKLADRMATEGLIDRRSSAGDRRVVYAGLTELGLSTAQRGALIYAAGIREYLLPAISAESLAELAKLTSSFEALVPDAEDGEQVATQRDPALPDRRRRGRD